jgi:integrase
MPRPKAKAPSLRYHLSGQSVTTIDGKDYYLGKHDSPESLARYAVLVRIYQEHELSLPHDFQLSMLDAQIAPLLGLVAASHQERQPNLVRHLTAAYLHHATKAYANSKSELHRAKQVCGELDRSFGNVVAEDFGPRMLKTLRESWVDSGKARKYVNSLVQSVWRIWRFGVSEELVSESTLARLKSLEPLREGQTTAKENEPRKPVAIEVVRRTVAKLSPVLRDMVRVHVATGMRPSELCSMRPCDIDRSAETWVYRPPHHKNRTKGKKRAIPLVGDARDVVTNYLNRDPQAYLFSPAEAVAWWQAQKRAARKSKVQPSQIDRSKDAPEKLPGDRYTQDSYRRAIDRACKRAGVERWFPYQIRHLTLTQVRDALGAEAAQAIGGHSRVDMTEVYAKLSEAKAIEAARAAPVLRIDL